MKPQLKVVTQMPLAELWRPDGSAIGPRIRKLNASGIAELLRTREIEFVIADVGKPLRWINARDRFTFWKKEVQPHVAEADSRIELGTFPGGYCYTASQWEGEKPRQPIVLLELHH